MVPSQEISGKKPSYADKPIVAQYDQIINNNIHQKFKNDTGNIIRDNDKNTLFFGGMEMKGYSIYDNEGLYTYKHLTAMLDMKVVRIAEYKDIRKHGKIDRSEIVDMELENE